MTASVDIETAVAVFKENNIQGEAVARNHRNGIKLNILFTKLPSGKHGLHIHKAGDLRGEGCHGLCEHYDIGHNTHGGEPGSTHIRHTGDLGNIYILPDKSSCKKEYYIPGIKIKDLWGRSIIVHEDEDDLGKGPHDDSKITGHSGARIGCAIFGRGICKPQYNKTRKHFRRR
jgi:Cu-Zn family superoxide dismutase